MKYSFLPVTKRRMTYRDKNLFFCIVLKWFFSALTLDILKRLTRFETKAVPAVCSAFLLWLHFSALEVVT